MSELEALRENVQDLRRALRLLEGRGISTADYGSAGNGMRDYSETSFETYDARADSERAREVAATDSPFHIEVRFLGGLTPSQKQVFKDAADRWAKLIVGDLPDTIVAGEIIDDVRIDAQGVPIDGVGGILGQAGPQLVRPQGAGKHAFLPVTGIMQFDTADLASMENRGVLNDVITHEMGHVLGCNAFVWERKGFVIGKETENWAFTGPMATAEYGQLIDPCSRQDAADGHAKPVPIENLHGPGTRGSHWRETVFGNELMTGFVGQAGNPLSRITGGMFGDIGYDVDLAACDPYQLPSHLQLAELGLLAPAARDYEELGVVLPTIPLVASDESMDLSRLRR
ncbi:leishmanolysin-related zinc metalloendopeptidase [Arthrobacter sp. GCM10027362]|uniref:leishmanolysin-related zinc metalloendopeptidase n=1 Tax=Arthrobacter sp. GCM10027362 TaxID=3273379 RepID=UPI0036251E0F